LKKKHDLQEKPDFPLIKKHKSEIDSINKAKNFKLFENPTFLDNLNTVFTKAHEKSLEKSLNIQKSEKKPQKSEKKPQKSEKKPQKSEKKPQKSEKNDERPKSLKKIEKKPQEKGLIFSIESSQQVPMEKPENTNNFLENQEKKSVILIESSQNAINEKPGTHNKLLENLKTQKPYKNDLIPEENKTNSLENSKISPFRLQEINVKKTFEEITAKKAKNQAKNTPKTIENAKKVENMSKNGENKPKNPENKPKNDENQPKNDENNPKNNDFIDLVSDTSMNSKENKGKDKERVKLNRLLNKMQLHYDGKLSDISPEETSLDEETKGKNLIEEINGVMDGITRNQKKQKKKKNKKK